MPQPGQTTYVAKLPQCDFCYKPARYDFRTVVRDSWAYGCETHYQANRAASALGIGNGQYLLMPGEPNELPGEREPQTNRYATLDTTIHRDCGHFVRWHHMGGCQASATLFASNDKEIVPCPCLWEPGDE